MPCPLMRRGGVADGNSHRTEYSEREEEESARSTKEDQLQASGNDWGYSGTVVVFSKVPGCKNAGKPVQHKYYIKYSIIE